MLWSYHASAFTLDMYPFMSNMFNRMVLQSFILSLLILIKNINDFLCNFCLIEKVWGVLSLFCRFWLRTSMFCCVKINRIKKKWKMGCKVHTCNMHFYIVFADSENITCSPDIIFICISLSWIIIIPPTTKL
jgi:hypothetical protein